MELVLEAGSRARHYWRDLWRYRELFWSLAWRDFSVRYRQTVVGAAWAFVQPVVTIVVMTIVFGTVAGLSSQGRAPYALLVVAGTLPFQFFSAALISASGSLVANSALVSKVYFPRVILPAAAVVTSLVDLVIGYIIVAGLLLWFRFVPGWQIATLPLFTLLACLVPIGPGMFFAALNVKYRDFRYVIPFLVQLALYLSPVGYSSALVRERFGDTVFTLYCMNPLVGIIDGFRWAILGGTEELNWIGLAASCGTIVLTLAVGIGHFRRTENRFADVI
jgi:lipopolysaccharide transport system permease protein